MQKKERQEVIRLLEAVNIKSNNTYPDKCIHCNSKYKNEDLEEFVF
jgi:hypothetical protein